MGHQWIVDVLVDLKSFAQQNELPMLAEELAHVTDIANAELHLDSKGAPQAARSEQTDPRRVFTQT